MPERSSNNTARSATGPAGGTTFGDRSEAPTLLNIWPLGDNFSKTQMDFVASRFTPQASRRFVGLGMMGHFAFRTGSTQLKTRVDAEVRTLFDGEAERISRPARTEAAEAALRAAVSRSQQEAT